MTVTREQAQANYEETLASLQNALTDLLAARTMLAEAERTLARREAELTIDAQTKGSNAEQRRAYLVIALAEDDGAQTARQLADKWQREVRELDTEVRMMEHWLRYYRLVLAPTGGSE